MDSVRSATSTDLPRAPAPTNRDDEDQRLIERIATGDMVAFEALYRAYARRLGGYLWRRLRRSELVDEAVNDVMMVVWQKAESFEPRGRVATWLFGIAHNKALSLAEKERRHVRDRVDDEAGATQLAEVASGPADIAEARIELDDLRRRIEGLSEDHRAVVELTFFAGLSYGEIAEVLHCPVNTVKTRMFHARKQILRAA